MSQPTAYERTKNFQDDAGSNTDHGALNDELDAVSTSISEIRINLALLQNDDGTLKEDAIVIDNSVNYSFDANGLFIERSSYDGREKGFSFLSLDTKEIYFKLSSTSGDWSTAAQFGLGPTGAAGADGDTGPTGPAGTVDYSQAVSKSTSTEQTIVSGLKLPYSYATQYMRAPQYRMDGTTLKISGSGERIIAGNTSDSDKRDYGARAFYSEGTDATDTGFKLSDGTDIGTLFDPAGTGAGKVDAVDETVQTASLSGKTSISVNLVRTGNTISLVVGTS